jgi:hypothetical protein
MHAYHRQAGEREGRHVAPPPTLQKSEGEGERHGQEQEARDELVLGYAPHELSPKGNERRGEMDQEE